MRDKRSRTFGHSRSLSLSRLNPCAKLRRLLLHADFFQSHFLKQVETENCWPLMDPGLFFPSLSLLALFAWSPRFDETEFERDWGLLTPVEAMPFSAAGQLMSNGMYCAEMCQAKWQPAEKPDFFLCSSTEKYGAVFVRSPCFWVASRGHQRETRPFWGPLFPHVVEARRGRDLSVEEAFAGMGDDMDCQ